MGSLLLVQTQNIYFEQKAHQISKEKNKLKLSAFIDL